MHTLAGPHRTSRLRSHAYPSGARAIAAAAWDLLFALLVAFPFFTGGFWMEAPGPRFELTQPGPGLAVLIVLGLVFRGAAGVRAEHSVWISFFTDLWNSWREAVVSRPVRTLAVFTLGAGTLWAWASLRRHADFGSGAYDLGIFSNTLWNLVNGHGYVSSIKGGVNLFTDHQSPILWAFAPFYALMPSPKTLLVLQAFGLAAGAPALYRIGKQYLPDRHWTLALTPLLYWFYLPLRNANAFDFHPETMMLPLFLWAIALLQEAPARSRLVGGLCLLAALGAKESAGPVAAGIGLAWILGAGPERTRSFTRAMGAALLVVGPALFWFDLKVVPRLFGSEGYFYTGAYRELGDGLGEIILSPFLRTEAFLERVTGPARLKFLFVTLAPLAFLPLAGGVAVLAALPGYLMIFLTAGDLRLNPMFHYAIEPSVGLFWALAPGLARAESWLSRRPDTARAIGWFTVWVLFWSGGTLGRMELYRIRKHEPGAHERWLSEQVIPCVRPDVPVVATGALVPHLSNRHWVMDLPRLETPASGCVIQDSRLGQWPMTPEDHRELPRRLAERGYSPVFECESLRVWSAGAECMSCVPECGTAKGAAGGAER